MIDLGKITQGERGTLTVPWEFPEYLTSPASVEDTTITATMTDENGDTTAVSGTLTGTAATTCTWALSAGDSGTAGTFTVVFQAIVTGVTTYTLEATLEVIANPSVTGTQNDPLVSISAADAAWVTLAATAVPDGGDVVDANDLGTAAYAATGDFDAAGAAAAAQAAAVQRANHTGTQLLSTISDAGTMAAQATTSYYAKTDFSAAPTAAEPLKADGSGGVSPKTIDLRGAAVADFTALFPGKATTAYGIYTQSSAATGGLSANGFTNTTATAVPVLFTAYHGSTTPTSPAIIFRAAKHNGTTSAVALAAAESVFQVRNWTSNVLSILGSGRFGIRRDSPGAQLDILVNGATTIGEIVQLAVSQTADALQIQSSAGAVLAKIEANGTVQAAGYKSGDGSAGWTGTFTNGDGNTVTVKNGLITGVA